MINKLNKYFEFLLENISFSFKRDFLNDLKKYETVAIIGERGIGKTYTVLQYLKENKNKSFYFSADNPLVVDIFSIVSDLVLEYNKKIIAIDEIHKFPNWQQHLKSIIDSFPGIQLIVLGSSSLDIYSGTAALARRIYNYKVYPLNFKEFLKFSYDINLPSYSFNEIINNYKKISFELSSKLKNSYFKEYINFGFYPYYKEKKDYFYNLLATNLKKVILEDLGTFLNIKSENLIKIEKLFFYIANNSPSDLNYSSLSKKIGISNDFLENILFYLDKVGVVNLAIRSNKITDIIKKEFKIFLGNPNLYYAFLDNVNIGTVRESFVLHNFKKVLNKDYIIDSHIILPRYGDFIIDYEDKKYLFEVGGQNKTTKQIKGIENSFVISDDILVGEKNKIPIWLFGLIK